MDNGLCFIYTDWSAQRGPCTVCDWIGSGGYGRLRMTALSGRQNIYVCRKVLHSPGVSYFRYVAVMNR